MIRSERVLNPELLARMAGLGHTQSVVICDAGLPLPPHVPVIDLTLDRGRPPFVDVLEVLLDTLVVESAIVADELTGQPVAQATERLLTGIPTSAVPHTELKAISESAQFIVRTGECTPYANVVLIAGVDF